MVVGAFWLAVMSALVKVAGQQFPTMQIVFLRALGTLALAYAVVRRAGIRPVLGSNRHQLVQRGVLGATALMCFIFSITHLPLAESTLIQYTNPIFAILVASIFYREHAGPAELLALAGSIVGVLLVTRPAFLFGGASTGTPITWVGIALMGAAFSGAAYATIRQLPEERPEVVVLYLPLLAVPMSLPFAFGSWTWPTFSGWLLIAGICITTQLGQMGLTRGLQLEKTARATMAGYTQIIFAVALGMLFFGERLSVLSAIGAAIVLASTLGMAVAHRVPSSADE
jgi:drug/metabolite transporter (DMT)-like permease